MMNMFKNRTTTIFKFLFSALAVISFTACSVTKKEHKNQAVNNGVNVILIIADDAGWNDVGYNGSEIKTPNIDLLAKQGVVLNRFYTAPTCSPSRAALLMGMPASRIGIVAPIDGKSEKTLPDTVVTLPQALKKNNYQTALIGKWHLGLNIANGPNAFGFDYSYGFLHGQIDQYTHVYKNGDKSWYRNDKIIDEEGHATDLITKEAISWLTQKRDKTKNFYLQLAYSAPHYPLQEEDKWKAPYLKTITDSSRRDYAAAMSHLDSAIGEVLASINENKLDENTLIVFMSDNGAQKNWIPNKEYNLIHGPNPVLGSNAPLRDFKTSNYEGAIRVPAILYWKDHLTAQHNTNYISVTDIMPTILSLAGAQIPNGVEGVNVWPSITANKTAQHDIYIRGHKQESLIHQPWKLIRQRNDKGNPVIYQLYNIEKDPEEKVNRIDEDAILTAQMKELLEKQFAKDDQNVNTGIDKGE